MRATMPKMLRQQQQQQKHNQNIKKRKIVNGAYQLWTRDDFTRSIDDWNFFVGHPSHCVMADGWSHCKQPVANTGLNQEEDNNFNQENIL